MNTYPRKLSEFGVVPDGHCINALKRTYYHTKDQIEDAANAQCAHIGLPLICEDSTGVYMSSMPLLLDYKRTKEMPLEERMNGLNGDEWVVPREVSDIIAEDYGGGDNEVDSDGDEIVDMKSLNPYHTLQLRPNDETTPLQASINVSTMLCLQRRITRSVRSRYMATYQWGGQWTNGKYMPNNGPAEWIEPDRDEDYKPLPEFHTTSYRQPHFKANMPPNRLTKLPQADTMDKLRFHAHFEDATGLDGIRTRMKGDLVTNGSIFIPRTR